MGSTKVEISFTTNLIPQVNSDPITADIQQNNREFRVLHSVNEWSNYLIAVTLVRLPK